MLRWIPVLALVAGCTASSSGTGSAAFTAYGEDFIEKEIPAATFEDGWTVRFTRFLVVVRAVQIEGAGTMSGSRLFDLVKPGPKPVVSFDEVPAQHYERVSFQIGPISADTEGEAADKALMSKDGLSVYVEGHMTKGESSKRFAWGFTTNTLYDRCASEVAGKETAGVVVKNGGREEVELTIHGDHFFYDDLASAKAKVRGDNIAGADADQDGIVTLEELSKVKLVNLENGAYGTGSLPDIYDLRAFVTALSRTLGHYRGEGECAVTRL
jgi:hypothetical protein